MSARLALALVAAALPLAGCAGAPRAPASLSAQAPTPPPAFTPTVPNVQTPDAPGPGQLAVADIDGVAHARPVLLAYAEHAWVDRLTWLDWGGPRATGEGSLVYNTCNPNCGNGKHKHTKAHVVLSKIESCGGRPWYTRATVVSKLGHEHGYIAPPCAGGP